MSSPNSRSHAGGPGLREQILRECTEMVRHALASGISVPASLVQTVEHARAAAPGTDDLAALTGAHGRLAKLVAPATPRALVLFAAEAEQGRGLLRFLPGPIPLVRQMMAAAMISVALFILSSLSRFVSHDSGDVLDSFGLDLLTNEVFWLASAGVGASFAMLFQVNEFIVDRSYDPKYESSYWIKFLIGVVAGFILVALIPTDSMEGAVAVAGQPGNTTQVLARPTLAMLGGFSASAVYRILNRLVSTVEGLFRGDPRDEAALREQTAAQRAAEEAAGSRLAVASQLVQLRQQLAAGAAPEEVSRQIAAVVASLVPPQEPAAPAPAQPPAPSVTLATTAALPPAAAGEDAAPPTDGQAPDKIAVPAIAGAPESPS